MSKGRTTGPFKVTRQSQSASAKGKSGPWHAVLVADRDVRVLSEDGELIRRLTLDPARDYQPHGGS